MPQHLRLKAFCCCQEWRAPGALAQGETATAAGKTVVHTQSHSRFSPSLLQTRIRRQKDGETCKQERPAPENSGHELQLRRYGRSWRYNTSTYSRVGTVFAKL